MDRLKALLCSLAAVLPAATVREFMHSETGQVLPARAVGLGWIATACATVAAVLWSASPAAAGGCGWGGFWPGEGCTVGLPGYQIYCQDYCDGFSGGGVQYCGCCTVTGDNNQECYCWAC
ncbi:MAG: hypothetical protein AB1505_25060 [Candidatus Latescibacterota bacterium]